MRNIFKIPKHFDPELKKMEDQLYPSILIEQTSSELLGIVNTIVMGMVSTSALAGVGQINSLNMVIFQFFNALSQGGTVMIAQNIGASDPKRAKKSFEQSLVSISLISLTVLLILAVFKKTILSLLFGAVEAEVMRASYDYFSIAMFAAPLWAVYYQTAGAMRSTGDTKTPMKATVVMNIVNILCSLIFAIGLKMGAMGVGIALTLSVLAGNAVCFIKLIKRDYHLSLPDFRHFKPDFALIRLIYSVGVPISIESLMFQGGRLIVQVFVSIMGTVMISAYQVANSISQIFQLPLMSYNTLIVTVVGRRAGAKGRQRVKETLGFFIKKANAMSSYIAVVCLTLGYPAAWIFTRDMEVIKIVTGLLAIYGIFMPFWSTSFNMPQGFKGARDTRYCLVVGTASMWITRVFGSWFLGVYLGMQAYGPFLAMCLDWVVRAVFFKHWFDSDNWLRYIED